MRIHIRAARINAGLTQQQACEKLAISRATLQNYESGKTVPSIEVAKEMSVLYEIPLEYLKFF